MNKDSEHLACCFDAYCKRLLKNEVIDAIRGEKRMSQRETLFSDLTKAERGQLQYIDHYAADTLVTMDIYTDVSMDTKERTLSAMAGRIGL